MNDNIKDQKVWLPSPALIAASDVDKIELRSSDEEFAKAFEILDQYPKRVTFWGSARLTEDNKYYRAAHRLAGRLSHEGYAIVSGGSGGIMEAANRGAFEAGGTSIGFNIKLPHEQNINTFTTKNLTFNFFFTRKVMLTFYAHAYAYFPGGFGTFDELFEVLTLMQTKKMPLTPVFLYGHDYWDGLENFIQTQMVKAGFITAEETKLYTITDDIDEIVDSVNNFD